MTPPIRMVSVPVDGEGHSPIYTAAYESIRKGAPGLSDATCQVIARSINMKLTAAPVREEGEAVDWEARDQELIERGLRTIRTHEAVRYLSDALSATTVRLTGYDWNADPDSITKQQGEAFDAADRVFADLDAAVASHPEIELPECQTCGGTGKIEEAARTTGANQHSACVRTCDDCDGCGFAPDDEPVALATREEAPAEAGERVALRVPLDNLVIAQSLSKELRERATDEARSYLYALRAQPQARSGEGQ